MRERIADGLTLRQFTDFYCAPVPKHDAFQRGFIRLTPQTLKAVNDLVVQAAVELGLEDGAKLRVDTTVVQTDIHHPTDNTLLWDVVRVVTRLVRRLAKALDLPTNQGVLRSHALGAAADVRDPAHDNEAASRAADPRIPRAHRHCRGGRRKAHERGSRGPRTMRGKDMFTDMAIEELREADGALSAGWEIRVIDQARRRVLYGEQVPYRTRRSIPSSSPIPT